jgi:hypothetical protein
MDADYPWNMVAKAYFRNDGRLSMFGTFRSQDGATVHSNLLLSPSDMSVRAMNTNFLAGSLNSAAMTKNGDLYVSGEFNGIGGVKSSNFARWNFKLDRWESLGSSLTHEAVLAGADGSVYVSRHGSDVSGIDRWTSDGEGMREEASGLVLESTCGQVPADSESRGGIISEFIQASDGALYVTGLFHKAAGKNALNIARWNGSDWAPLGTGLDTGREDCSYGPGALVEEFGKLYVGGVISTAGGLPVKNLAAWDGESWAAVPGTPNNDGVQDIASSGKGAMYVLFYSNTSEFTRSYGLYQFDGSSWKDLGLPVQDWQSSGIRSLFYDGVRGAIHLPVEINQAGAGIRHWLIWDEKSGSWTVDDSRSGATLMVSNSSGNQAVIGDFAFGYKAKVVANQMKGDSKLSLAGTSAGQALAAFVDENSDVKATTFSTEGAEWSNPAVVYAGTASSIGLSYRGDNGTASLAIFDGASLMYTSGSAPFTPNAWSQPTKLRDQIGSAEGLCSAEYGVDNRNATLFWNRNESPQVKVVSLRFAEEKGPSNPGGNGDAGTSGGSSNGNLTYNGPYRLKRPVLSARALKVRTQIDALNTSRALLQYVNNEMARATGKASGGDLSQFKGTCSYTLTNVKTKKVVVRRAVSLSFKRGADFTSKALSKGTYLANYTCSLVNGGSTVRMDAVDSHSSRINVK